MFFRGLVSRSQLHTILRYDKGVDAMLLVVLGECGLVNVNPSVLDSFKAARRHRAYSFKRANDPNVMKKRKYEAMLARGQCVREDAADGAPAYMSGQAATFDDDVLTKQLLKKQKSGALRRCSRCKRQGHTKAKCTDSSAPLLESRSIIPSLSVAEDLNSFNSCVMVFLDIETTSGSVYNLDVVQIAASALKWPSLDKVAASSFNKFARNVKPVSAFVKKKLTSMDWDNLVTMPPFKEVLENFFSYLGRVGSEYASVVLVAHNGKPFDIPALFNAANDVNIDLFGRLEALKVVGLCDTLMVAHLDGGNKSSCGLGALLTETIMYSKTSKPFVAHDASEDVDALIHIVLHNRRSQFSSLRRSTVQNKVVIPLPVLRQYCIVMKEEFEFAARQTAVVQAEESKPGFVPPLSTNTSKRSDTKILRKLDSKKQPQIPKGSLGKQRRRRTLATLDNRYSDDDEDESFHSGIDSDHSTSTTNHLSKNHVSLRKRRTNLKRKGKHVDSDIKVEQDKDEVVVKNMEAELNDDDDEAAENDGDNLFVQSNDVDNNVDVNANDNDDVNDPVADKFRMDIDLDTLAIADAKLINAPRQPFIGTDFLDFSGDNINYESKASLEPSLTKPQARVARQLKLCTIPLPLVQFMQSNGFISAKHNNSYERLQKYLRDIILLDSSTAVVECAKNLPVSAAQLRCLLERDSKENDWANFLNMDVINSFSAILGSRFPLCSITSTWIVVWALQAWTSMETKCSRLVKIDFDNDNIFFPVHHPAASHWSLVRLHWSGQCWNVYYVDSAFDQHVGDVYCNAIIQMVQAYLSTYRQVFADKAQTKGGKRVVIGRDQADMKKRASASFNRILLSTSKQVDAYNCGCFMMHTIESVLSNSVEWAMFPNSTDYFAAYRRRLLLTMFTFDGE